MKDLIRKFLSLCLPMLIVWLCLFYTYGGANPDIEENRPSQRILHSLKEKEIIWYHNIHYSKTATLKKILQSGIITHVMLASGHRYDFDYLGSQQVRESISIITASQAKIIWTKPLWTVNNIFDSRKGDLYQSDFYIREIKELQKEAKYLEAHFTGLDIEPYGNAPVKPLFKGSIQFKRLENALKKVIGQDYRVDFILPAGSLQHHSPYNYISKLGDRRISEDTYFFYKEGKWKKIKYPYDFAGIYLDHNRLDNSELDHKLKHELATAVMIFKKPGIFLYPGESKTNLVVDALCKIFDDLPMKK